MDLFQQPDDSRLAGAVERIIFRSEDDFFTIATLLTGSGTVTVSGEFYQIQCGDKYTVHGAWMNHPKYGRQFKVTRYEHVLPVTEEGICSYLASGIIKGIGRATARKLVNHFGTETLTVIEERPYLLEAVGGVGKKKAALIAAAVLAQRDIEQIMIFLRGFDVRLGLILKVYQHYGDQAIGIIKENPYRLSNEIAGIGFKTADAIALQLGVSPDSAFRFAAAAKHALNEGLSDGHTYLPPGVLLERTRRLLMDRWEEWAMPDEEIQQAVTALEEQEDVVVEEDAVYLITAYQAEVYAAKRLAAVAQAFPPKVPGDINMAVDRLQDQLGLEFTDQQKEIIYQVMETSTAVLTGGPGTGKTTVIRGIIDTLTAVKPDAIIHLSAPTGRAAKRLTELTGREAKTIHRLLGANFAGGAFSFASDEDNPLKGDLLIVDEFSMVDIFLANNLLKAIPRGMRLVLVGDVDQLPSVGPGNVLKDIINAGVIPTVRLSQIFRQAQESQIIMNAHRINQGLVPFTHREKGDFAFFPQGSAPGVAQCIEDLVVAEMQQGRDINDVQVLSPAYRGEAGVENLNLILRNAVNPAAPGKTELKTMFGLFRVGDKVIQVKNNYDKGVFNGNIGNVTDIYLAEETGETEDHLMVRFDEQEVLYAGNEVEELAPAFAITIHKAQGSEFPVVIMPSLWVNSMLSTRNLLYTGFTRARESLSLVGSKQDLFRTIQNNRETRRFTKLADRLQGHWPKPV
jgi:exodeoxyribonuclease V alpha subunit